jgi:uncharacterized protein (DUF488 family)
MQFMTIGHGTAAFEDVRPLLEAHGVAIIADVRSEPWSRRAPDFVKNDLEQLAYAAGFGYRWLGGALGGRPTDPALLDEHGEPDPEAITASARFQGALLTLEGLAADGTVVLLCAEADPARCHRSTILTPALVARGHEVLHIHHDGTLAPDQPDLGF